MLVGARAKVPRLTLEERRERIIRRYVEVIAVALNVVPLFVLVGWQFDLTFLKSGGPGFSSMDPVTAVCFITIGWALLLRLRGGVGRIAGAVLAAVVGLAGMDRLYAYITHSDCPLERFLFQSKMVHQPAAQHMPSAVAAALAIAAISILLLGYRTKKGHCPSLVGSVLVGTTGLFITNRYAFHIFSPEKNAHILTSFYSGILMIALATGLSVIHSDSGVMAVIAGEMPGSKIVKRLLLASFAVPYVAGLLTAQNYYLKLFGFGLGEALYSTSVTATFFLLVVIGAYTLNHVDSKRKDAEENIVLQRHFLQTIVDSVPNFIFVKAISGSYKFANKACAEAYGVTPEQLVGKFDMDYRKDRSELAGVLEEDRETILSGSDRFVPEEQFTDADGNVRWLQTVKRPVPSLDRRSTDLLGVCTDITNRKQITEALREAEAKLDGILASIEDVVWSMSVDGKQILYVNPAVEHVYGHEPVRFREYAALRLDMVHPEDKLRVQEAFAKVFEGGVFEAEYRIIRADGAVRWILDHARVVTDVHGRPLRLDGMARDITEGKVAKQLQDDLIIETERSNKAKSEFLSRMSHELRTPLNSILGFAQVLQLQNLSEAQLRSTEHILKGGQHLLALINEVLDISRIEAGSLSLSCEPVGVKHVVDQAVGMISPLASQRELRLTVETRDLDHVNVRADRQRLVQVLINLLSNAVKYNRDGGSLTISWDQTTTCVQIRISDTGHGIPSDKLHRLFAPFDRLEAQDNGFSEGTGLGLALSRSLVEAMNGTLGLEKTSDEGSTFLITLPAAEATTVNLTLEAPSAAPPSTRARKQTAIYIEDNPANAVLVEQLFSMMPEFELLVAMQGRLGLDLVRQHRPDFVLLDIHLPDCGGDWVLEQIKADPTLSNVPVVMLSADATETQINKLMQAGAYAYLTKPLEVDQFFQIVRELTQEKLVA